MYRAQRQALIRKTGPEAYHYYNKKVGKTVVGTKKGPVDYEGVILIEGVGRSVFFDAKQTTKKHRLSLHDSHVPKHQKAFLWEHAKFGAVSFLYIARVLGQRVSRFLYPVTPGSNEIVTAKSLTFVNMLSLPSDGRWLETVLRHLWLWDT